MRAKSSTLIKHKAARCNSMINVILTNQLDNRRVWLWYQIPIMKINFLSIWVVKIMLISTTMNKKENKAIFLKLE